MTTALISGAGVAGPALAYWLHRYGFDVTLVESARGIRTGGYPIDVRGPAVQVAERMGILPELRAAHIDTRRISVVNGTGRIVASLSPGELAAGNKNDIEIPRGQLGEILYGLTRNRIEYVFGDSVATLEQHPGGVDVTFEHGAPRTFDHVIGADGLHSTTRRLAFGPERDYHHYLGYCFAGFEVPNTGGLSHEALLQNTPGRLAALYAVGDAPEKIHALLAYATPEPTPRESVTARVREVFAGLGGETPRLLDALEQADDLYSDTVSQIRMPAWTTGRVSLLGDAAYAPSFLTGQGTTLALVGAYLLARNLGDSSAYEQAMRGYVTRTQTLGRGAAMILPRTGTELWLRNQAFRLMPLLSRFSRRSTPPAEITLPEPVKMDA
ncbi:FAD-dependent monooxygenase [Winogradskya humida]|uniref:Oxidoreductase n=1 Tax=Winogradskya humida TaxID=113566 RepID=A0ABQ3ZF39_9ACTN|nr:FAD-dependent monooxygenase [Actinoplanes humidus]GIE17194.1 oxidoreductase [Actinoplanes humidus]